MPKKVGLKTESSSKDNRLRKVVKTLPLQSKIVLFSILNFGQQKEVTPRMVYERYYEICMHLDITPLTQLKVTSLILELDMLGIINAKKNKRIKQIDSVISSNDLEKLLPENFKSFAG